MLSLISYLPPQGASAWVVDNNAKNANNANNNAKQNRLNCRFFFLDIRISGPDGLDCMFSPDSRAGRVGLYVFLRISGGPVSTHKFHLDFSVHPLISLGFQCPPTNFIGIPVSTHKFH